jgi:hypothetical protein
LFESGRGSAVHLRLAAIDVIANNRQTINQPNLFIDQLWE